MDVGGEREESWGWEGVCVDFSAEFGGEGGEWDEGC